MLAVRFLVALLFYPFFACTLPTGNPSEPSSIEEGFFCKETIFSLKTGYLGDLVFSKSLKVTGRSEGPISSFFSNSQQGVLLLNFIKKIEFYGSIGAAELSWSQTPFFDHERRSYQTHNQLAWGTGARGIIFHRDHLNVGIDIKYFQTNSDLDWITLSGSAIPEHSSLLYRECQASLGISYTIDFMTPYLCFYYSRARGHVKSLPEALLLPGNYFSFKTKNPYGMSLGCTLSKKKRFSLTVEVDLFTETAIALSGNIQF